MASILFLRLSEKKIITFLLFFRSVVGTIIRDGILIFGGEVAGASVDGTYFWQLRKQRNHLE